MNYGTLVIKYPEGNTSEYTLDQPSILIGRTQGNDLVLDHPSVSRRHARFSIESGQLYLEDLGSANGSFIDLQKLDAESPTRILEKQAVRLGEVTISYKAPAPVEVNVIEDQTIAPGNNVPQPSLVTPQARPAPVIDKPMTLSFNGPKDAVLPGNVVTASLTILNRGNVVDEMTFQIAGIPIEWIRFSKERVALLPNSQEQVTIIFQPLRQAQSMAGDYRFTLTVYSREYRTSESVYDILTVLPFYDFGMELMPVRSRRDFQLIANNRGNSLVDYHLQGVDEEAALIYQFSRDSLSVQPGQRLAIPIQVKPRVGVSVGSKEMRSFVIVAYPSRGGGEVRANGQFIYRPPIPIWLIPVVLLLGLCILLASASAYATLCPTYAPNLPFCPKAARPNIQALVAEPVEVQQGGTIILGWNVTDADQVQLTSPIQSTLKDIDTMPFKVDQTTTFTIKASNFAGSVEKSVIVQVKSPNTVIQSFSVDPKAVIMGQTKEITLSWVVNNADSVNIIGYQAQSLPTSGSITIPAPTDNTTYKLIANSKQGALSQDLPVAVVSAGCVANNNVKLLQGPFPTHPTIIKIASGTPVQPDSRTSDGTWLRVAAENKEGWLPADSITCATGSPLQYPTVEAASIPTPVPTMTPTNTPTQTATATPTETPTPGLKIRPFHVPFPIFTFPSPTP